jgi:hypothetical protein
MSLGIIFKGPEGIVLAADSRVSLTATIKKHNQADVLLPSNYDNATKLLKINDQKFVGAVTYGLGVIGQKEPRTAHSYIPEFESELLKDNVGRLSIEDFTNRLSNFFMQRWQEQMPKDFKGPNMIFLVGGYDEGVPYGKTFEFNIPSKPIPVEHNTDTFGVMWGGQKEHTDRLIQGFDDNLLINIQKFLNISDEKREELRVYLRKNSMVQIPYAFLPLQDCVDLSIFLIRTTISIQNWIIGIRGVGGAIDVAIITRTRGFETIQQKIIIGEKTREV